MKNRSMIITIAVLNAINKPFHGAAISIIQMFVIYIPVAMMARQLFGYQGIFYALAFSYVMTSGVSALWLIRRIESNKFNA